MRLAAMASFALAGAVAAACSGSAPPSATSATTSGRPAVQATLPVQPTPTVSATVGSTPEGAVCTGPDVDWSEVPALVQAYGMAWNERDDNARLRLLETAFAEEGSYVDPTMHRPVVGRAAVAAEIGQFHATFASGGEYFEPRPWGPGNYHHDRLRMPWRLCGADGLWFEGEDVGVIDANGMIREITGFFDIP